MQLAAESAGFLAAMLQSRFEECGLVGEEPFEGDAAFAVGFLLVDALDRDEEMLVLEVIFVGDDRNESR